jgi:hypothetical protein
MRIKPYPVVMGTTIKRGCSVKPGVTGLRLAKPRKKSEPAIKLVTAERSQMPARAPGRAPIPAESIVVFDRSFIREFTLEPGQQDSAGRVELELKVVAHGSFNSKSY